MLVRFGLKVGNVKIGSMFLYIFHGAIVKHGQRFIHTASSVNPTIVQKRCSNVAYSHAKAYASRSLPFAASHITRSESCSLTHNL